MKDKSRLFRKEVLARRGKTEPLNGLLRVTGTHEWAILFCLGISILAVAAWALFGSIEQSISAQCVLVAPGDRYTVLAENPGNVLELLAEVGDTVEAGQSIARIRTPDLSREIELAQSRIELLEEKYANTAEVLQEARRELIDLEARAASGQFIATPFAGVITAFEMSLGQAVRIGDAVASVRSVSGGNFQAVAMLLPEKATRLAVGMEAHVLGSNRNDSDLQPLAAKVDYVSPRTASPPAWLADLGVPAHAPGRIVRLSLRDAPPSSFSDGNSCTMRVVLRSTSPARLLLTPGSN